MTAITTLAASFGLAQRAEGRWPHTIHLYRQRIERVVPFVREHLRLHCACTVSPEPAEGQVGG